MYRRVYIPRIAASVRASSSFAGCFSHTVGMKSGLMTSARPEHELLRLCVRRRLATTEPGFAHALLRRELDWAYLVETASRQLVVPLLAETIHALDDRDVPPAVRADVSERLKAVQARNSTLALELVRLHRLASAASVTFLSFKGPLLATSVYGDLGLRQFGDLDILVDGASFSGTEAFLTAHGYRRVRDFGYEVSLLHEHLGVTVDLHRALSPDNFPVATSFGQLWARRAVVPLHGASLETLSRSDLLIALCIEAVKDARQGKVKLGKMSDVAHVAMSGLDWRDVETQARHLGVRRVVSFVIGLVADVLQLSLNELPGPPVDHPRLTVVLRDVHAGLFGTAHSPSPSGGDLFHFHLREAWRDKLRLYVRRGHRLLAPNALDRQVLPIPAWLSPLYYLVRPLRLAGVYGRQLARGMARAKTIP
jgi:putative nucleotidyltransferase-like protein